MIEGFDPHRTRIQLRQELKKLILQQFGSQKDFAPLCGCKKSQLSKMLRGTQGISLEQLDAMTTAFGLPEDHFYPLFKGECFGQFTGYPVQDKSLAFIRKCLQIGRNDLAHELYVLTREHQRQTSDTLLKQAEEFYHLLPHINLLPERCSDPDGNVLNLKLDAYRQVLTYFHLIEEWDELFHYANELEKHLV